MRRRSLLRASAAVSVVLAGCATLNPFDCDSMHENVIRAEPMEVPEAAVPVQYEDLPDPQRDIADAAIEDEYRECDPISEEMQGFFERVSDAQSDQSSDIEDVYLTKGQNEYGLYVQRQDVTYSSP